MDQAIVSEIQAHNEILPNLEYLADNIGGRLTGSAALRRATDWAEARMKSYGLQNVHREAYTIPEGWERGVTTAHVVSPANGANLSLAAMAWTHGTDGTIQGQVLRWDPRSSADVDKWRGKLKNAVILLQPPSGQMPLTPRSPDESSVDAVFNNPAPARKPLQFLPPSAEPQSAPRDQGGLMQRSFALFRSEGVGAILIDAGRPLGLDMMFGSWEQMGPFSNLPFPILIATDDSYTLLYRLTQYTEATPGSPPVRIELNDPSKFIPGPITVENVVGELPGSDHPNEYVVLGAHLDSWDLAQGATDNGTGTCVVLETARALIKAKAQPRRTMRFLLFTGEEEGDIGSTAYVKAHAAELPRISMCLVDDAGTGKCVGVHTQAWWEIGGIFKSESAPTLAGLGFTRIVPGSPIPGGGGGSDHDEFEGAGVPGFILDQLDDNYHLVFHSQADTFDKADPDGLNQTADVMAILGLRVANLPGLLPRTRSGNGANGN